MSELLFLQALRDVGAERGGWQFYRTCMILTLQCLEGHEFDIDVHYSGAVELDLKKEICINGDEDDVYLYLRSADGNLTEAVRFAENLRRVLAGEPPLETPHAKFGRLVAEYVQSQDDWLSEEMLDLIEIAEKSGVAKLIIDDYNPEVHGDIEGAEPGCKVWSWKEVQE